MAFSSFGSIQIFPKKAKLTHDTEFFGKMDPYCVFKLGDQKNQSEVHKNGGKFPVWKDMITLHRQNEDILILQVWDKDLTKNDLVGETEIIIASLFEEKKIEKWYTINYKVYLGKTAGSVLVELVWVPEKKKEEHDFKKSQTTVHQHHDQNIYHKAQTQMFNDQSPGMSQGMNHSMHSYHPYQQPYPNAQFYPGQQPDNPQNNPYQQPQHQFFSSEPKYPGQIQRSQTNFQEYAPYQSQQPNQYPHQYQQPNQYYQNDPQNSHPYQMPQRQSYDPSFNSNQQQYPHSQSFSSSPQYPGQFYNPQTQCHDMPPHNQVNPQFYQSQPAYSSNQQHPNQQDNQSQQGPQQQ